MSKRTKLKGFTLVELLVVIAIIAILATVSVVGYLSFTKKAKESNDISLTTQMNTALEAAKVSGGDNETCYDAVQDLKANGIIIDDLEPSSTGYKYLWNSKNDSMVLYDDSGELVAGELDDATNDELFAFIDSAEELSAYTSTTTSDYTDSNVAYADSDTSLYSIYLTTKFDVTTVKSISVKAGIDTGVHSIDVKYTGTTSAIIRTSGTATLTIETESGSVSHYGEVGNVIVSASSYTESGEVSGNISVSKGEVTVEAKATVSGTVLITSAGVTKVDVKNTNVKVNVDSSITLSDGVVTGVTAEKTEMVTAYADLVKAIAAGGNVTLGKDITVTSGFEISNTVVLNLNGYTISCTGDPTNGLFYVNNETANLTIEGTGKVELTNVKRKIIAVEVGHVAVNGGTYVSDYFGFDVRSSSGSLEINDCNVTATEFALRSIKGGKITVNGGEFTSTDNAVVATNGTENYGGSTITINGGTFNGGITTDGYIACGVYVANSDTVTINGGTFNITNGVGILMRSGNTTIGKNVVINLTNTGDTISGKVGDSKITVPVGAALVADTVSGYPGGTPSYTNNSEHTVVELTDGVDPTAA